MMSNEFIWPIRVYYEDTDAGGVVYFANYLKFFERARTEWLNELGIDQVALLNQDVAFVVKKTEVDFARPAKLNDELEIVSKITQLRGASLLFEQAAYWRGDREKALCQGIVKVVCLTLTSFIPRRIPAAVMEGLQRAC